MSKLTAWLLTSFVFLSLSLIFSPSVLAARKVTIESFKPTFNNDEEGEVKVSLVDFTDGESIFIKGAFSQPDSSNYFGYTKKGDSWIKNSVTSSDQLSVKIGEWDGKLTVKPDLSDSGFAGSGDYNFKIGFYYYTSGGNLSSVNWSDTKPVSISFVPSPTPTPTVTLTPTSVPTSSPSNTPAPTVTAKPQSSPTVKPSNTPVKISPSTTPEPTPTEVDDTPMVLGESVSTSSYLPLILFLIGGGLIFISLGLFLAYRQRDLRRNLLKQPNP